MGVTGRIKDKVEFSYNFSWYFSNQVSSLNTWFDMIISLVFR